MNTKLYVGNLSPVTTAEDLRMLFARTGQVVSVEMVKDRGTGRPKGFAFVEMVSQGDAGKAVSEYNGYTLDRRQIKVTAAHAREAKPGRTGGYVEYKSYNESVQKSYNKNYRTIRQRNSR